MFNTGLENLPYEVVGLRLPNGQIKVVKSSTGTIGEVCMNESVFLSKYRKIDEGCSGNSCIIMDMVNG